METLRRWALARSSLAAGNAPDAAQQLRPIIAELLARGMRSDAANAHLDLAEALLILGELEEVEAVCQRLFALFGETQMPTGAMTAASFLKEAAAARLLSRDHVKYARAYLDWLKPTPALPFPSPKLPRRE